MEHIANKLANGEHEASLGGLALLLLDLDGFKVVNDSLGHDAGDALLKEAANRMQAALRDSDYLARLGGDEFLVVVPQVSDVETAERVGEKLAAAVSAPYDLNGKSAVVTVSIGVSMFPKDARDREGLLKCADLALYEAKHAGRNQLCFYELGMRGSTRR
jgi:diguanylate cyclase (GGDEF)-like protein